MCEYNPVEPRKFHSDQDHHRHQIRMEQSQQSSYLQTNHLLLVTDLQHVMHLLNQIFIATQKSLF